MGSHETLDHVHAGNAFPDACFYGATSVCRAPAVFRPLHWPSHCCQALSSLLPPTTTSPTPTGTRMQSAAASAPDPVIAAPSGVCCIEGYPHVGTPKGEFVSIAEVETYVTRPPSKEQENRVIFKLYFPDVWGINDFQNGQLLCDYFASNGFLVLALDYFCGDPVTKHRTGNAPNPGFDFEAWKAKHQAFAKVAVPKWIAAVKAQFGTETTKYACVGYCFGAPYVMDCLSSSTSPSPSGLGTHVGAFGHPAFLNESHFTNCARPLFLSCAETDHTFPAEARHRAEELLTQRAKEVDSKGMRFQIQLFSGVSHGFSLRGDMSNPWERYAKEESASGIVRWFKMFMD
uniref:Dienelactone hydrolase n=1 Tax=Mycena chlorophos TaxID=658473 RepID=A0ABQ0L7D0_MYCCL|nr:dienelactone hydrolase [Mycena chlorophos]